MLAVVLRRTIHKRPGLACTGTLDAGARHAGSRYTAVRGPVRRLPAAAFAPILRIMRITLTLAVQVVLVDRVLAGVVVAVLRVRNSEPVLSPRSAASSAVSGSRFGSVVRVV